jgi:probable HAF family extracellular repeat protein
MKTILTSIAVGGLITALAAAQPQTRYKVIDLGTLGGGYSLGFAVNDAGSVAGAAATAAQTDGFAATAAVWKKVNGKLTISDLGILGPPPFPSCPTCNSSATAVVGLGEVAMASEIATLDPNGEDFGQWDPPNPNHRVTRVAVWRNGVMTALPNLPGGNNANAFWANNLGQISGVGETGDIDPSCSQVTPFQVHRFQAVVWGPNGQIQRPLPPLQKDWVAYGFTINDIGQVVGASGHCATTGLPPAAVNNTLATRAVLWEKDGSVTDLGDFGGASNIATSINNYGQVVGSAQFPNNGTIHTFLWTRHTGMLDYGAFPGAVATFAGCCHTVNDSGQIVGSTLEPANPYFGRALVWQGRQPKDLNDFVSDAGDFVYLFGAYSINNSGEIVCGGVTQTGELHACLAIPNNADDNDENNDRDSKRMKDAGSVTLSESTRALLRRRFGISKH